MVRYRVMTVGLEGFAAALYGRLISILVHSGRPFRLGARG